MSCFLLMNYYLLFILYFRLWKCCFPCGSAGKESACNMGDLSLTPGLGRAPGEGKGYPLQYSGLENSMDCIVHGVAKSQTQLSNFHFHGNFIQKANLSGFLIQVQNGS